MAKITKVAPLPPAPTYVFELSEVEANVLRASIGSMVPGKQYEDVVYPLYNAIDTALDHVRHIQVTGYSTLLPTRASPENEE